MIFTVYLLDVSPLTDDFTFEKYHTSCPEYRRQKTELLAKREDRARSVGAEILLSYGMNDLGNPDYDIAVSESGKPFDKSSDIFFNLSHSGMYAAAVFDETDVGIDIETPREVDLKLAERYFSPEERAQLSSASDREHEFLRIWTRKEALLKACGKGIAAALSDISTASGSVCIDGAEYTITTISENDCILSVARRGAHKEITVENIMVM